MILQDLKRSISQMNPIEATQLVSGLRQDRRDAQTMKSMARRSAKTSKINAPAKARKIVESMTPEQAAEHLRILTEQEN